MAEYFQGRMLYPRGHRGSGRPHPSHYAGAQHRRTPAHAFFGTQPAYRGHGISGSAGRVFQHMLHNSGYRRFNFRPSHLQPSIRRRRTTAGHQAQFDMAQQKRDYRQGRYTRRREFGSNIRNLRRDILREQRTRRDPFDRAATLASKARVLASQQEMANLLKRYQASSRTNREAYQQGRRTTAGRAPMYAAVQRNWGRNVGFRPTGRRPGGGRWGFQHYRGGSLYNRRRGRPSRRRRRRRF